MEKEDIVITPMPPEDVKIKKTLSFHYINEGRDLGQVDIVYLRDYLESYEIKNIQATNGQEIEKLLSPNCPQEDYPHDELDDMILAMVKEKFPDTKAHNHLLVCSNELRNLQTLKNVYSFNFRLFISPNMSTLSPMMLPQSNELGCSCFTLSVFTFSGNIKECLSDYEFSKDVDFSGWLNTYNKIEQGLKTLHQPSEYFI